MKIARATGALFRARCAFACRESQARESSPEMKFLSRNVPPLLIILCFGAGIATAADDEKSVEFQGTVSAVDLAAKTITVRARQKDFVFQIDLERCRVVKEGRQPTTPGAPTPGLKSAQVGDSVVGRFVVEGAKAVVTHLYLMAHPEPGVRVKEKPGYITSPYQTGGAIDVRGYRRGTMLVDETSGKIFLVP
ncbi:hypothetical protein BH18VER2_BH18VER2_13080 [soil metagenome]